MMHFDHMWGPRFAVWGILMAICGVLIIVGSIFLIRWLIQENKNSNGLNNAKEILNKRFARGEIDKEDYEKRRRRKLKRFD